VARVIRDRRKTRPVHGRTGYQARPAPDGTNDLFKGKIIPIAVFATGLIRPARFASADLPSIHMRDRKNGYEPTSFARRTGLMTCATDPILSRLLRPRRFFGLQGRGDPGTAIRAHTARWSEKPIFSTPQAIGNGPRRKIQSSFRPRYLKVAPVDSRGL
jgi:hypothetical protein